MENEITIVCLFLAQIRLISSFKITSMDSDKIAVIFRFGTTNSTRSYYISPKQLNY